MIESVSPINMIDVVKDPQPKIQIGILPPPLGGISVYLYRLSKLRSQDLFIDLRALSCGQKLKLFMKADCEIVIHGTDWRTLFLLRVFQGVRRQPYSVVLHGEGWLNDYDKSRGLWRWIIESSLRNAKSIQVVGKHIEGALLAKLPELEEKMFVRNAFLPPPLEDEPRILASYGQDVHDFIANHKPLIIANAFQLAEWKDGTDLYGLDMCVELMRRLKKDYPQSGMLFALANDKFRPDYYAKMKTQIVDYGLQEQFYFLTNQHELWPLFRCGQLMVRPTCTDGFALSIQEALSLGCPVVASNVGERPVGAMLFHSRDMDDFECKVRYVLNDLAK